MAIYYVATTGSDTASGTATSPFRTINEALSANLKPGDEIIVRPGTYNETLNIAKGGSAAGDVTIHSEVPGQALIRPTTGYDAIDVNANYVTIEGFDIAGAKGDGIQANNVHHITVRNNISHGNGESGIQFNYSDFITVEGNETYGNASSGWFSGISIYENRNITGDTTTTGYRTIVRNNISHDNVTHAGEHTDGNGIIIDDFQSTQNTAYQAYNYATLVENNLVYGNGGKGVQVTWSDHVTVSGNTAYHNNVDLANTGTWRGEISNAQSSNNTFVNNIAVADSSISGNTAFDNNSYSGYVNKNVIFDNNLLFNGIAGQNSFRNDGGNAIATTGNQNLIGVNPLFVDAAHGNFELSSGSKAIDAGTDAFGLGATDVSGNVRVVGKVDIGAEEYGSSPPSPGLTKIGESGVLNVLQENRAQWHSVSFSSAIDNPSVVMGPMTMHGGQPASLIVRNVTSTGFEFQIKEWNYLDGYHANEQISWMAVSAGTHTLANGQVIAAGSSTASGVASTIGFGGAAFNGKPLVMAQVASDSQTATVTDRIMSVGTSGFKMELQQQEANATPIKAEAVDWIALDSGTGTGGGLMAGSMDPVDSTVHRIDMPGAFGTDHFAFIADMQTMRGPDTADLRLNNIFVDSVAVFAQEEQSADVEMGHTGEAVGYIAMDPGLIYGL